jgi:HSP20 family protein
MVETALQKDTTNGLATPEVTRGVTITPRVDILENEEELLLYADVPGVTQDDVDIRFENGELTLHARRTLGPTVREAWLWENETGDFFRAFRISEQVDGSRIWAELKNGVLTLHLPKVEAAKPRKITVKGG